MTIKEFILECENYSHYKEHYELMKEAYEHNLLCEYIDYIQYNNLMSNNELSVLMEDAQQKKEGIIDKIIGKFKYLIDMFIRFLSKFIPSLRKQEEQVVEIVEEIKDGEVEEMNSKEYQKGIEKEIDMPFEHLKQLIFGDFSIDRFIPYIIPDPSISIPPNDLNERENKIMQILVTKEFKIKPMKDSSGNYLQMNPHNIINACKILSQSKDVFDNKNIKKFLNYFNDIKGQGYEFLLNSKEMEYVLNELKKYSEIINSFENDFGEKRLIGEEEFKIMNVISILNISISNYIEFSTNLYQFRNKHFEEVKFLISILESRNERLKVSFDKVKKAKEEVSKDKIEKLNNIKDRHQAANDYIKNALNDIMKPLDPINDNSKKFKEIDGMIDELKK